MIKLLPVLKTGGRHFRILFPSSIFYFCLMFGMSFCSGLQNFVKIELPLAELWRHINFFQDGGRSHIGFDLHNIRPPPKCSWWSEVGQDILNIFCKCGTTVAVNAEFHCQINWCSALQQILYCACSHDNFQSFRYNDISKEYSMSHKYLFHMYNNNTSYAHLEIFMQFVAITICTVAQNCCKGDEPCQWNTPIFRPSGIENPWTDRHQIWQGWLRRGPHPTCKLCYFYPQGDGCTYTWNCHHPLHWFFSKQRYDEVTTGPVF